MNKKKLILSSPAAILLIAFILIGSVRNGTGNPVGSDVIPDPQFFLNETDPFVYDDFNLAGGLEVTDRNRVRYIQTAAESKKGIAETFFSDPTAKYNVTLHSFSPSKGKAYLELYIEGKSIGMVVSGAGRQKTFTGINVEQWSRIRLEFYGNGEDRILFERLVFTPAGLFDGTPRNLMQPVTLDIFTTREQQIAGRQILGDYVRYRLDSLSQKRQMELSALNTPADWRARQKAVRDQLARFFGEFPEKTPLNPKITGKLDYDRYTIEKVIFESQPGYYVTANLYIPKNRDFPVPGVLFPCGHSDEGKGRDFYHMSGLGLVLKGYVVLVFDPTGQGERSEYIDPASKKNLVNKGVDQHHYVGKPAFLTNFSLSGLRTWDAIRALDYLVSRPEVDKDKLAAVGCSGGGQMSLLITAVDERIKVCAASHPGGSMENTYLTGQVLTDREILSLIPPRPLRIIVGIESGEEPNHGKKLEDMQLFYAGLAAGRETGDMDMVPGVHSMNRSNRQSAYEWLNKWMDREAEGKAEDPLKAENEETLWCTESGNTLLSLGGETGQSLNAARAEKIYRPEKDPVKLKERILKRVGLEIAANRQTPGVQTFGTIAEKDIRIEKLTYESEKGMIVPSLLITPAKVRSGSPVCIFASDKGKPESVDNTVFPWSLVKEGYIVLAIDVRGTGETSPTPLITVDRYTGYTPQQWQHDCLAIQSAAFGRTMTGMRAFDMIRAVDLIKSRSDLKDRKIVLAGEGQAGLYALLTSICFPETTGVITIATLPSYRLLVKNQYFGLQGYFWVPGALCDYDIPDLARLAAPRPQIWVAPVDQLGTEMTKNDALSILGKHENMKVVASGKQAEQEMVSFFTKL